jgi:hypothetical protein
VDEIQERRYYLEQDDLQNRDFYVLVVHEGYFRDGDLVNVNNCDQH